MEIFITLLALIGIPVGLYALTHTDTGDQILDEAFQPPTEEELRRQEEEEEDDMMFDPIYEGLAENVWTD